MDIADLRESELRPLRARLQMIFQDPQSSLNPRLRLGVTLTRPLQAFGRLERRRDRRDRAAALLGLVGLPAGFVDRPSAGMSFPAASASAPASPARWRCSRS